MQSLRELMETYRELAPACWRDELLLHGEVALPPEIALQLADEIKALGITIMAVDGWDYVDDASHTVSETLVHFYIGDEVLDRDDAAEYGAVLIKEYIRDILPPGIPLVAYTLDLRPPGKLSFWEDSTRFSDNSDD